MAATIAMQSRVNVAGKIRVGKALPFKRNGCDLADAPRNVNAIAGHAAQVLGAVAA
jgi:hypothetical protein